MGTDPVRATTNIARRYHNLPPFRPPLPLLLVLEQAGARAVLHEKVILKQILPKVLQGRAFPGGTYGLGVQVLGRSCLSEEAGSL